MNLVLHVESNDGSEYIDDSFDPLDLLLEENARENREKTFLPPKPAAVRTREEKKEKKEKAKEIAESNKKAKDTKNR